MPLYAALYLTALMGQLSSVDFDKKIADLGAAAGPGCAVAVYRDGKAVYQKAFGVADEGTKAPYTMDTAFEVGSLSKQFTATAILMLVKEGKIALKDPIGKYLDGIPETWKPARIEQVLHHMSGIPDYEEIAGYDFYNKDRTPEEVIAEASKKPLDFKPGDNFNYSNTGYFLLGMIVSKTSGTPIGDFLEDRVFRPVGMTKTFAVHRPSGISEATGYHSRTGTRTAQPPIAWSSTLGAGGIVSTIEDMEKWDEALYTSKLLPDNLRNLLWSTTKSNLRETIAYGFGWFSDVYRGLARKQHTGQTNGFTCSYYRFPAQHMAVFVQTNTYGGRVDRPASVLSAHFLPQVNYLVQKPAAAGAEQADARFALIVKVLGGQADPEDLSPSMLEWSTGAKFADVRKEIQGDLEGATGFRYVLKWSAPFGQVDSITTVYRAEGPSKTKFWSLRFAGKRLVGFNIEDE